MISKILEKNQAIELRKRGLSYREILEIVPVAKSSLSLWLKSVKLARSQKQRLTEKKLAAMKRGWEACHRKRVLLTEKIKKEAKGQIGRLTKRELWLIGIALYWGEGNKEKDYRPGSSVQFSNSDPNMIKTFLKWIIEIIHIPKDDLGFQIYIHENCKERLSQVINYWAICTGFPEEKFIHHIYFKKNKIKTKRKNIGDNYFGLLRIRAVRSSGLQRKIQGWTEGICNNCGVVQW
ncbi:MAG: hypothetical protein HYT36_03060 [Candidatus Staskawiczbacteria bacterium]|nr:hypothetical protein [Candidatus Staskawiczbacteria bacterium]